MPPSISFFLMSSSITRSGSMYSGRRWGSCDIYVEFDAYLDFGMRHLSFLRGCTGLLVLLPCMGC